MKRKRHTAEEIIKKLREAAGIVAGGKSVEEAARQIGVSVPTYHRWKQQYGGADRNTVKRLKKLEQENSRLKKLVADQALDNAMLKELVEGAERSETDSMKCCPQGEAKPNQSGEPGAQTRCSRAPGAPASGVAAPGLQGHQSTAFDTTLRQRASSQGRKAGGGATSLRGGASATRLPHGHRATAQAGREHQHVKRVARIWRQEGLRVPQRQHKRRRLGNSGNSTQRRSATRMNEVWSYDFVFDQTEDGKRLKWLPIRDEFTRESVALEVERRMEASDVVRVLATAVAERGAPAYIRSDNGPEFVAKAVREWIASQGFQTLYIEPGSPWQNAYSGR